MQYTENGKERGHLAERLAIIPVQVLPGGHLIALSQPEALAASLQGP